MEAAIALLSRGHHPGASRWTLLTLVFRHVQAKHTPRRVKLRNGRSGTYTDVTFFMLDDEYTAMVLLPERDSSERALIFLIAYKRPWSRVRCLCLYSDVF